MTAHMAALSIDAVVQGAGPDVYEPDVAAFRAYSDKTYLESPLSQDWPEGMLDKINKL
ncbi:MAG: hypothetical protein KF694_16595 [Mesorhizobium sp.]|nr:hypothetical protein [Mesorhizobium sp.]